MERVRPSEYLRELAEQCKKAGRMNQTSCEPKIDLSQYGIYERYKNSTFDALAIGCKNSPAFVTCHEYAENFAEYKKRGVGMILKGEVGTGKTSLAVAILQEVIKTYGGGYFIPMVSLMDNILTMSKRDVDEAVRFEKRIRSTPLLVLDDLGAEYENSWVRTKVDAIITERYNRKLPIIITTNLKASELMSTYQERTYDRLKGTSIVINFTGESMRKAPKRGA